MKFLTRRRLFTRRGIVKFLILVVCVSLIYLSFQILSIHVLSDHARQEDEFRKIADNINSVQLENINWKMPEKLKYRKKENWHGDPNRSDDSKVTGSRKNNLIERRINTKKKPKYDNMNKDERERQKFSEKMLTDNHPKNNIAREDNGLGQGLRDQNVPRINGENPQLSKVVKGVLPENQHLYKALPGNKFQCTQSKEQISYNYLNDDFCDCMDGSDEPSTSACENSRFYCTFQLGGMEHIWVASNRVNDGLCDCCDGSDEWAGNLLDKDLKKETKKYYNIYQAPCLDRCEDLNRLKQQQDNIRQMGSRLKQAYLQSAKEHGKDSDPVFGPRGVFFKLSLDCYQFTAPHFDYTVCPFKSAKQRERSAGHSTVVIARGNVQWMSTRDGQYKVMMTNGDGHGCPDGGRRSLTISFSCGLENAVNSVSEEELCKYAAKFTTPAAC